MKSASWTSLLVALLLSGCGLFSSPAPATFPANSSAKSEDISETKLRVGDQLTIRLDTGGQTQQAQLQPLDVVIDENGEISMPLIDRIKAAGLTSSELSERIAANYVPRYYVRCNATVIVTLRFFYVGGEVRAPGRYNWTEDITLLKALNTAGGFTDYANRGKVEVIRGKQKIVVNCEEMRNQPAKDIAILPGDSIWVARSIF